MDLFSQLYFYISNKYHQIKQLMFLFKYIANMFYIWLECISNWRSKTSVKLVAHKFCHFSNREYWTDKYCSLK